MARVTDAEVKEVFETTIDTTPFITAASLIVTAKLTASGYSDELLKEIERYLTAHFACAWDPRESQVQAGASATFEGQTGKGLDFTRYGQLVKLLDTAGILARLGKPAGRVTVASRIETDTAGEIL